MLLNKYINNKNINIKFLILSVLFLLGVFIIYKYFTYKKEPFQNSCPDCVFNGVDPEYSLNKCNEDPISIPVTGATNTLIGRAINSLNLENVTKSMDSTLWNRANSNVQADTCPPVATTGPQTTEVSIPTIKCSYGSLTYVDSNSQPLIDNNQKIIVVHKSDFPDPIETAVGFVINGKNVPENTTIVECYTEMWPTYGKNETNVLVILLSNPITKYDKDQTFCYQPPPINCEIKWPLEWSDCVATCDGIKSTASGTKSQTGTRSVPLGTNLYGGTDCPTVLIQTEACTKNCPVSCKQNNPWTDDSTSTCKVPGKTGTNATCGTGGKKRQTRAPASGPLNGGQACSIEQNLTERLVDCELPPCALDCVLGDDWVDEGPCKGINGATCGAGKQTQERSVLHKEKYGGKCTIPTREVDCNLVKCPGTPCVLGIYEYVDSCVPDIAGATCGPGTRNKQQKVDTPASALSDTSEAGTCNNPIVSETCSLGPCKTNCKLSTSKWIDVDESGNVVTNAKCKQNGATCGTGTGTISQIRPVDVAANGGSCDNPVTPNTCNMVACNNEDLANIDIAKKIYPLYISPYWSNDRTSLTLYCFVKPYVDEIYLYRFENDKEDKTKRYTYESETVFDCKNIYGGYLFKSLKVKSQNSIIFNANNNDTYMFSAYAIINKKEIHGGILPIRFHLDPPRLYPFDGTYKVHINLLNQRMKAGIEIYGGTYVQQLSVRLNGINLDLYRSRRLEEPGGASVSFYSGIEGNDRKCLPFWAIGFDLEPDTQYTVIITGSNKHNDKVEKEITFRSPKLLRNSNNQAYLSPNPGDFGLFLEERATATVVPHPYKYAVDIWPYPVEDNRLECESICSRDKEGCLLHKELYDFIAEYGQVSYTGRKQPFTSIVTPSMFGQAMDNNFSHGSRLAWKLFFMRNPFSVWVPYFHGGVNYDITYPDWIATDSKPWPDTSRNKIAIQNQNSTTICTYSNWAPDDNSTCGERVNQTRTALTGTGCTLPVIRSYVNVCPRPPEPATNPVCTTTPTSNCAIQPITKVSIFIERRFDEVAPDSDARCWLIWKGGEYATSAQLTGVLSYSYSVNMEDKIIIFYAPCSFGNALWQDCDSCDALSSVAKKALNLTLTLKKTGVNDVTWNNQNFRYSNYSSTGSIYNPHSIRWHSIFPPSTTWYEDVP